MSFACNKPGCKKRSDTWDTIIRYSAKGNPFVGYCIDHYPLLPRQRQVAEMLWARQCGKSNYAKLREMVKKRNEYT